MINDMNYKDSGIEWIGAIPDHWEVTRLKFHGDVLIGLSFDKDDLVDEGEGTLVLRSSNVQNSKVDFSDNIWVKTDVPEKLKVRSGDILICSRNGSRRLIGKNCLLGDESTGMTWGVFMSVFRTKDSRFFYWVLNSQVFETQSGLYLTSTINQLTVSTLQNLTFPYVKDPNEQKLISRYLDKKTDQIDSLIEKIEKKIELLKEQRTSLINQCVTKGLDPNVEMKDSGVEWIGEIPKHWEVRKLKHFFSYKKGSMGQQLTSTFLSENEGEYPVYSGQTENDGVLGKWEEFEFDFVDEVIFCTTVGAKLMTTKTISGKFSLSQNCLIMVPKSNEISSTFVDYFFKYDFFERRKLLPSILQPSLRMEDLDQYLILVPPFREQNNITTYLERFVSKHDQFLKMQLKKLDLLREHRQSLISATVTGKVRVTEDMI